MVKDGDEKFTVFSERNRRHGESRIVVNMDNVISYEKDKCLSMVVRGMCRWVHMHEALEKTSPISTYETGKKVSSNKEKWGEVMGRGYLRGPLNQWGGQSNYRSKLQGEFFGGGVQNPKVPSVGVGWEGGTKHYWRECLKW